jgi:hypothetical protein
MSVWNLSAVNLYADNAFIRNISSVATINTLPYPYSRFGNVLMVDPVNGSDGIASRNGYPYKTVEQAVSNSTTGDTVWIMPGTYNLCAGLFPHSGTCLRGLNTQTCQINLCNVTTAATLITMSSQVRVEDLTLTLHSASNVSLTGFEYPSGTSLNSKIRTAVVNVYSDYVGGNTVIGLHSPGTSATSFSSSSAIRACTINVSTASTGKVRGLLIDGPNRFAIRDTNIISTGPSNDNVGVETTNISAFAELKSSSIGGTLYDINRTSGNILLGFTDLLRNSANGNSFSVVVEGSTTFFGIVGNLQADTSYFVGPGTTAVNALPSAAFPVPVTQDMALYTGVIQYTGSLTGVEQIHMDVYRNNNPTRVYTISMGQGMQSRLNNSTSVDFTRGDTYYAIVRTIGNPDTGTFTGTLGFY